jgi:lysophospholipase L1-like esterase
MNLFSQLNFFQKLACEEPVIIEAFGSSNTQRRCPGMTWFDYIELGFKKVYGGNCGIFINAGIGGNTSKMLLERFDRDVSPYHPDLVIITIGGNDSVPSRNISCQQFRENLLELHSRVTKLGGQVVLQTYYACMLEQLEPEMAERMLENMQTIRDVAAETGSPLQDHYTRWSRLQHHCPQLYQMLMGDAMHVNADGNSLLGLDLLRSFAVEIPKNFVDAFKVGFFGQQLLDLLEEKDKISIA